MEDAAVLAMIRDLNGPDSYTAESAAIGYINDNQMLFATQAIMDKMPAAYPDALAVTFDGHEVDAKTGAATAVEADQVPWSDYPVLADGDTLTANETKQFLGMNYTAMVSSGINQREAAQMAWYRLTLVRAGALAQNAVVRKIKVDEVCIVNLQDNGTVRIPPGIEVDFGGKTTDGMYADFRGSANSGDLKTINRYWPVLVGMAVHVFRTRGHHYMAEYNELYNSLRAACVIPNSQTLAAWEYVMRTAIHPFGIYPLAVLHRTRINSNLTAGALILRKDAAPAGAAIIATSNAAAQTMARAPWYNDFYNVFKEQLDKLEDYTALIKNAPDMFHMLHWIYGFDNPELRSTLPKDAAVQVSAYLLGYINTLPREAPITGQEVITKPAMHTPGVVQRFERFIDKLNRNVDDAKTFKELMEALAGGK